MDRLGKGKMSTGEIYGKLTNKYREKAQPQIRFVRSMYVVVLKKYANAVSRKGSSSDNIIFLK